MLRGDPLHILLHATFSADSERLEHPLVADSPYSPASKRSSSSWAVRREMPSASRKPARVIGESVGKCLAAARS